MLSQNKIDMRHFSQNLVFLMIYFVKFCIIFFAKEIEAKISIIFFANEEKFSRGDFPFPLKTHCTVKCTKNAQARN